MRQVAIGPANLSPGERQEIGELVGELNRGEVLRDTTMRTSRVGVRRRQ